MAGVISTLAAVAVFVAAWTATSETIRPCNDTIGIAATCVMPGRSLLPAVPLAISAGALVATLAGLRIRRRS